MLLDEAGVVTIDGTISAIADGIKLTNTTNTGADAIFVTVIIYGGADITISVGSITINSSVGSTATGAHSGFTDGNDKLAYFIGTDIDAEDTVSTGINNSYGVCHITGNDAGGYTFTQRAIGWAEEEAAASSSPSQIWSNIYSLSILT